MRSGRAAKGGGGAPRLRHDAPPPQTYWCPLGRKGRGHVLGCSDAVGACGPLRPVPLATNCGRSPPWGGGGGYVMSLDGGAPWCSGSPRQWPEHLNPPGQTANRMCPRAPEGRCNIRMRPRPTFHLGSILLPCPQHHREEGVGARCCVLFLRSLLTPSPSPGPLKSPLRRGTRRRCAAALPCFSGRGEVPTA